MLALHVSLTSSAVQSCIVIVLKKCLVQAYPQSCQTSSMVIVVVVSLEDALGMRQSRQHNEHVKYLVRSPKNVEGSRIQGFGYLGLIQ